MAGLAYDCETESLYATSLAGSTPSQEVGRIFRIDLECGQVVDQLEGVDAMGVAVYSGTQGKRLYDGLARRPEVYSIALDETGDFVSEPRTEFSIAALTREGRDTVRCIRFPAATEMTLRTMDFNYSLQVAGERQEDVLTFVYDPFTDSWSPAGG